MKIITCRYFLVLIFMPILVACKSSTQVPQLQPTDLPASQSTATQEAPTALPQVENPVIFSEIMAGLEGNNNYEFIELYNRTRQPVDLQGWSIWYRLPSSQDDLLVYRWKQSALIPPLGHYLLGQASQDLGISLDTEYIQPLNTASGGLQLRQMDGSVMDVVGWGNAPIGFYDGSPSESIPNGSSLERLPGINEGNQVDTDDNQADFALNPSPGPQNTGSSIIPASVDQLAISVSAADTVQPGGEFVYAISITNTCGQEAQDITVVFNLPTGIAVLSLPDHVTQVDNTLTWTIPSLDLGEKITTQLLVRAPWTYYTAQATNYYVSAGNCSFPAFGSPIRTRIEGGVIPIATARGLTGADLTIEGVVTMQTGASYAGIGNTKFYLQDDTGGIQVYVLGGQGKVGLNIGTHVSVRGTVQIYRGAMEIVPIVVPDDVTRSDIPDLAASPQVVSIHAASTNMISLPGKLVQVEGSVNRVEEFSYSYEIDLLGETGDLITLYVDKQTNINVERVEVGQLFRATGILDLKDTSSYLYPRIQEDLQQIYPPELLLEVNAPPSISSNGLITYTLNAINHKHEALTDVTIKAAIPEGTMLISIQENGFQDGNSISWVIDKVNGDGASQSVHFSVSVTKPAPDSVMLESPTASAFQLTEPVFGNSTRTFSGDTIPIWAIQGSGFRSGYIFMELTTQGIVTGIFPGLGGFFIQETTTDDDPLTSEGIFITTGSMEVTVHVGDLVQVTGIVREPSNQTVLQVTEPSNIAILGQNNQMPSPIKLDPPSTTGKADIYYEALEGMVVTVRSPAVAVSPTSKYGEYVIVLDSHNVDRLFQGKDNGFAIMVDDSMSIVHPDNSKLEYTVKTGDQVSNLVGPLAFSFGRYKIEPVSLPEIMPVEIQPEPVEPAVKSEFSIMTWNVENLYDYLEPNPSDPLRPTLLQYQNTLTKVANTIRMAGGPTIVALQEVENIGILQDLSAHDLLKEYNYQPILLEGTDSRGIDVGYLVRSPQAQVVSVEQRNAPEDLFSRPPLVLQVQITTGSGKYSVFLINNHFASMSSGVDVTEPQRTAQAAWNASLVQELRANDPDAFVVVLGDLNSFYDSIPIQTLRDAGLQHILDTLPADERYTYIFEGQSQVLDHIMLTSPLYNLLSRVDILRTNSDYPPQAGDDVSPLRKSDHDPVIATFAP